MKNTQERPFTHEQMVTVNELCTAHDLDPSQISFDGAAPVPIFDYEAVSALSLKLTDIKTIDCEIKERKPMQDPDQSHAVCVVVLPDGRSRTVEDSAVIGEETSPGRKIETRRDAEGMAQNRAVRRGIRSVGVNLWNAHRTFMRTGEVASGTTDVNLRLVRSNEIHALADELGYTEGDYRDLIAAGYDGRRSTSELTDHEQDTFAKLLRSLRRVQRSRNENSYKAAA